MAVESPFGNRTGNSPGGGGGACGSGNSGAVAVAVVSRPGTANGSGGRAVEGRGGRGAGR